MTFISKSLQTLHAPTVQSTQKEKQQEQEQEQQQQQQQQQLLVVTKSSEVRNTLNLLVLPLDDIIHRLIMLHLIPTIPTCLPRAEFLPLNAPNEWH